MEVVVPVPDFRFDAGKPGSPPSRFSSNSFFDFHHHRHISAPNSPTSAAAIYAALRESAANTRGSRHSSIPFDWEERPGTPKSHCGDERDQDFDFDFTLGFSQRHPEKGVPPPEAAVASADELFELGMIRPLKLPPRLYTPVMGEQGQKSPRSGGLLSPLRRGRNQRGKELDPFAVAMVEATRSRKGSRSLSPFGARKGDFYTPESSPPRLPPAMPEKGRRGWKSRLKGLFLFRSSSEGGTTEGKKNDICKYSSSSSLSSSSSSLSSVAPTKVKAEIDGGCCGEESRCSSFRSSESGSTQRGAVAPHELENRENRTAVEMRKTVMPYKQSKFSIRSLTAGKFDVASNSRRS